MKGILLAGGAGTRLQPLTKVVSKQLLPVYDKPIIYYSLSTLLHAGVTEVLLISDPVYIDKFKELLGDGNRFGIEIRYTLQQSPRGIAEALIIGKEFIGSENFWLILGDNFFHGPYFGRQLKEVAKSTMSTMFAYHVNDPSEFGVVVFDDKGKPVEILEKPKNQLSNWAIPGLYYLNGTSIEFAENLTPSVRGELEITDVLKRHLEEGSIQTIQISRGNAWFDLGTFDALLKAGNFVQLIQSIQGQTIGDPIEAAKNAKK